MKGFIEGIVSSSHNREVLLILVGTFVLLGIRVHAFDGYDKEFMLDSLLYLICVCEVMRHLGKTHGDLTCHGQGD